MRGCRRPGPPALESLDGSNPPRSSDSHGWRDSGATMDYGERRLLAVRPGTLKRCSKRTAASRTVISGNASALMEPIKSRTAWSTQSRTTSNVSNPSNRGRRSRTIAPAEFDSCSLPPIRPTNRVRAGTCSPSPVRAQNGTAIGGHDRGGQVRWRHGCIRSGPWIW
jgi:hypothetical protein